MPIRRAIVQAVVSVLLWQAAGPVVAAQPASLTFSGTHAAGGTVAFTVDTASEQIVALELEGVAGGGCTWDVITLETWGGPIQVAANAFEAVNADGDTFAGQILDHGRIEGTVVVSDPVKGCSTDLHWVANIVQP